jgi:heme exporter protein A
MAELLEVSGLSCRRGGRRVLDDVSFTLGAGDLLTLTGANGSGKTTLLRALALLVPAEAGAVQWQGADVTQDRDAWRRQFAWLGHLDGLKGDLTVAENLWAAERLRGPRDQAQQSRIEEALAAFDLPNVVGRAVRSLSAGQRRRTALARVLAADATLWLLDEPMNALDAASQMALRFALETHLGEGGLAIAATHVSLGLKGARVLELGK